MTGPSMLKCVPPSPLPAFLCLPQLDGVVAGGCFMGWGAQLRRGAVGGMGEKGEMGRRKRCWLLPNIACFTHSCPNPPPSGLHTHSHHRCASTWMRCRKPLFVPDLDDVFPTLSRPDQSLPCCLPFHAQPPTCSASLTGCILCAPQVRKHMDAALSRHSGGGLEAEGGAEAEEDEYADDDDDEGGCSWETMPW